MCYRVYCIRYARRRASIQRPPLRGGLLFFVPDAKECCGLDRWRLRAGPRQKGRACLCPGFYRAIFQEMRCGRRRNSARSLLRLRTLHRAGAPSCFGDHAPVLRFRPMADRSFPPGSIRGQAAGAEVQGLQAEEGSNRWRTVAGQRFRARFRAERCGHADRARYCALLSNSCGTQQLVRSTASF